MFLRPLVLALAAMSTSAALADERMDRDWELLAVDGLRVEPGVTLRLGADGKVSGRAPCNSYGAENSAPLPAFALGPIRATQMACPRLDEEGVFFEALAAMTAAELHDNRHLILTGADGRSLEFVADRTDSLTPCKTCPPKG